MGGMVYGSKEHCAELRRMREGAESVGLSDKSTDLEWLRQKLFEYMNRVEGDAAEIERLRKIEAAAIKSRTTDEYGLLSVEAGWELDKALNPSEGDQ